MGEKSYIQTSDIFLQNLLLILTLEMNQSFNMIVEKTFADN